ncbi:MAG: response regulator transcription factor [Flavobacteriales bacterium]|nr:response regulator transcription factor [Flavobacteriales bacterium]
MIRCLIVDDEEMARASLERLCSRIEDLEVVGTCDNALDAMSLLKKLEVDLLFLDIEMPDFSGIDLVKTVDHLPDIIFTTTNLSYAYQAFELRVTDYIAKPVSLPRLLQALEKVRESRTKAQQVVQNASDQFFVRSEGQYVRLETDHIQWIETVGDYVKFVTTGGNHIVHSTLTGMAQKLASDQRFFKVHRSFIVNLEHVENFDDVSVVIGQAVIPVSKAHRGALLKRISLI